MNERLDETVKRHYVAVDDKKSYGCHFDLEPGMTPDHCVLDTGKLHECMLAPDIARQGKDKWSCPHWRPA